MLNLLRILLFCCSPTVMLLMMPRSAANAALWTSACTKLRLAGVRHLASSGRLCALTESHSSTPYFELLSAIRVRFVDNASCFWICSLLEPVLARRKPSMSKANWFPPGGPCKAGCLSSVLTFSSQKGRVRRRHCGRSVPRPSRSGTPVVHSPLLFTRPTSETGP